MSTPVTVSRCTVPPVSDAQGRPTQCAPRNAGPYAVLKVAEPNVLVSGARSYRIAYDVAGAMNPFADHDELFWNVNGGGWDVRTLSVTAAVHTPGGVQRVTCFEGRAGSQDPCRSVNTATQADFAT